MISVWAKRIFVVLLLAITLMFIAINLLALAPVQKLLAPARQPWLVLTDVDLVDPKGDGRIIPKQMVIIQDNIITYVGDDGSATMPDGATIISGKGQYLLAGLWDSHVHTLRLSPQLHFPLLIANGVTSIRDMGDSCSWSESISCQPETPLWREQMQKGEIVAPRLVQSVSYHVEEATIDTAALNARIALLQQRDEPFLKIQLDAQTKEAEFASIMATAKAQQVAVAGHLPFSVDVLQLQKPFVSIEHDVHLLAQCSEFRMQFDGRNRNKPLLLNGWSEARCHQVLQHLAAQQIIYVPTHIAATGQDLRFAKADASAVDTLQAQRYLPMPQRWLSQLMQTAGREEASEQQILADFHHAALALTKQASAEGVIVLAGTDALDAGVIHGFSLHEELQYLVLAGLSPAQALYSATLGPAKAFGMSSTLGAIEAGMLADLVLLSADPLADITNTTKITAVIADGRLYQQQEREQALNYVEEQAHTVTLISRFLRGLWFDATPSQAN